MITLSDVHKSYETRRGPIEILRGIGLTLNRGDRFGLLGRNGAGKSTMFRLVSGVELPTSGSIVRTMSVSWPLAFSGGFQGALTGYDNVHFICRVYGVNFEAAADFVRTFTELGPYLREPVRVYSSGMRARLAFALSMAVEFDCYLIDEVTAVGDARFRNKCQTELFEKRADRALFMVSHDSNYLAEHCDRGGVLHDGTLSVFDTIGEAIEFHETAMAA